MSCFTARFGVKQLRMNERSVANQLKLQTRWSKRSVKQDIAQNSPQYHVNNYTALLCFK